MKLQVGGCGLGTLSVKGFGISDSETSGDVEAGDSGVNNRLGPPAT